ncbi:hypothetical protein LA080_013086 [Diaporthe eres]|nr:hypothetical protein LA080_013086 [Diaporthe eres]
MGKNEHLNASHRRKRYPDLRDLLAFSTRFTSVDSGAAIAMADPDHDDGTSLLGEALEKLMIREEAIDQEISSGTNEHVDWFHPFVTNNVSRLAPVSKEWQKHTEDYLFEMIRIDPTVEEDVLKSKELFKNHRRRYLKTLDIIVDDRPTGPWHTAGGMLQISLAMEKVGQFLSYLISWNSDENEDLDSDDSGENESLSSLYSGESEDLDSGDSSEAASIIAWDFGEIEGLKINFVSLNLDFPEVKFAPKGEPSIQTSSLWTASQLNLLTSSDLSTEIPLPPISSAFPNRFSIARHLTFPLDCVPLPATIAIMQTMPNLKSCSFELAFKSSSEEGMARLTDFLQQLPALLPSPSDLTIRVTDIDPAPGSVTASANRLSAALRDYSQNLRSLKVEGIFMQQNFFEQFGVDRDLILANQLSLTPAELLIAAGRATVAMTALKKLRVSVFDDSQGYKSTSVFYIKREPPQNLERSWPCRVKLSGFSKVQEQWILEAWIPFMKKKTQFVSEGSSHLDSDEEDSDDDSSVELPTKRIYRTLPSDYSPSTTFGAGALVNNTSFLEAQRLARFKLSIQSVPWEFGSW